MTKNEKDIYLGQRMFFIYARWKPQHSRMMVSVLSAYLLGWTSSASRKEKEYKNRAGVEVSLPAQYCGICRRPSASDTRFEDLGF